VIRQARRKGQGVDADGTNFRFPSRQESSRQPGCTLVFKRLASPILFLIVSLTLVGGYLAFAIPVSVFPNTDFPRIVIGVDNGVMPIDQMLVVITRPIEEAVNRRPLVC